MKVNLYKEKKKKKPKILGKIRVKVFSQDAEEE